jgi:succinate dehydrogenase / fumarate reductase membrane anchor subunit
MLLLIVSTFWHSRLGVQVVIDDYQSGGARVAMTVLNGFFHVALGATAVFAVLKIAFGGDPAA